MVARIFEIHWDAELRIRFTRKRLLREYKRRIRADSGILRYFLIISRSFVKVQISIEFQFAQK